LDSPHRLIKYQELFFGTIDAASIYPREIVKATLKHNTAALILAHNHPQVFLDPPLQTSVLAINFGVELRCAEISSLELSDFDRKTGLLEIRLLARYAAPPKDSKPMPSNISS